MCCAMLRVKWTGLLVISVENASHPRARDIAIKERIRSFPAIAVRGTDGTHLIVV